MIKFVYQNKPKGTGDAVLKTKNIIKDNYFLMLLPDDLIIKKNCSKDMISIHNKKKCGVMASMRVNKKTVNRWGIYSISKKIRYKNSFIEFLVFTVAYTPYYYHPDPSVKRQILIIL
mgnify:CR=1 FL=1